MLERRTCLGTVYAKPIVAALGTAQEGQPRYDVLEFECYTQPLIIM